MAVKAVPVLCRSVFPYLTVRGATEIIDFLEQAFRPQTIA